MKLRNQCHISEEEQIKLKESSLECLTFLPCENLPQILPDVIRKRKTSSVALQHSYAEEVCRKTTWDTKAQTDDTQADLNLYRLKGKTLPFYNVKFLKFSVCI
jgi:hypothetical protein